MVARLLVASFAVVCISAAAQARQADPTSTPSQAGGAVYTPGNGVTNPVVVKQVDPAYTPEALRARIEGEVVVAGVVEPDGTLDLVRVTKSLDTQYGLDDAAVAAAKKWQFRPGTKNGQPVRVRVTLVLEFSLSRRGGGGQQPARTPATQEEFTRGTYTVGTPGLVAPKVKQQFDPKYTSAALREKVQGEVDVEIVVMPDGTVGRARVAKSLDTTYGLDDRALESAKQWTFEPGTLNGQPVPVLTTLTLEFRIH